MKTIKFMNLRVWSIMALAMMSLSSCLKDPRYINYADSPPLIEFPLAAYNSNQTQLVAITAAMTTNGTYTLPVTVNLASANVLTTATTFTVTIDNSLLTAPTAIPYNTTTFTAKNQLVIPAAATTPIPTYFPLPAADYTATGLSGVIPAGQRTAVVNLTFNPALIGTVNKNYALRLVITSGNQQVSNWNITTLLVQAQ